MKKDKWLRLRAKNINSTEVSALFGMSPYQSYFSLYQEKLSGEAKEIEVNERMWWGSWLQDAIATGIAKEHGLKIRRFHDYLSIPENKIGSSFDYLVITRKYKGFLLEIKNVDAFQFRLGWGEDIVPPHIELQVQHQLLVSKRPGALIGVLSGGNQTHTYTRYPNKAIQEKILSAVEEFWCRIRECREPEPDYERDLELIIKETRREDTVIASEDANKIGENCSLLKSQINELTKQYDIEKGKLLKKISTSNAIGSNWKLKNKRFYSK